VRPVAIAMERALPAGHEWSRSAADLALEVAAPLLDRASGGGAAVDALFVASPAGLLCDGQAGQGAVFADRLGLAKVPTYQLEAGDASGAAALHAAVAHVAAGLCRTAMVLSVAKVSDRSERERAALMDALIDREIEAPLGLTYQALCGLLADLYVARHGVKPGDLAHVCAKNAGNAVAGGETFLPHAPSALEIRRDIPVAPPLVRSDFAPLFDGATALIVTDLGFARELVPAPVEIAALAAASDLTCVSERAQPLHLEAASRAVGAALTRVGARDLAGLAFLEVSSNVTILEVLALESIGVCTPGTALARFKDGLGKLGSERVINPGGGAQGRGLAFGNGGLEQAREAFLQLSGQAGRRQVAAAGEGGALALALCLGGVGSQAFATVYRNPAGASRAGGPA
jgi:acetyl-CoA C-acetyltransferase